MFQDFITLVSERHKTVFVQSAASVCLPSTRNVHPSPDSILSNREPVLVAFNPAWRKATEHRKCSHLQIFHQKWRKRKRAILIYRPPMDMKWPSIDRNAIENSSPAFEWLSFLLCKPLCLTQKHTIALEYKSNKRLLTEDKTCCFRLF